MSHSSFLNASPTRRREANCRRAHDVNRVRRGEGEAGARGVQPVSEILPVRGVDFVGTIPAAVHYVAVFAAVVSAWREPRL